QWRNARRRDAEARDAERRRSGQRACCVAGHVAKLHRTDANFPDGLRRKHAGPGETAVLVFKRLLTTDTGRAEKIRDEATGARLRIPRPDVLMVRKNLIAANGELIRVGVLIDIGHLIVADARLCRTAKVRAQCDRRLADARAAEILIEPVA